MPNGVSFFIDLFYTYHVCSLLAYLKHEGKLAGQKVKFVYMNSREGFQTHRLVGFP